MDVWSLLKGLEACTVFFHYDTDVPAGLFHIIVLPGIKCGPSLHAHSTECSSFGPLGAPGVYWSVEQLVLERL